MDPIGTLMLLFAGFGWGKPVQVNPRNYTRKMSMEKADALVSAAGPIMNFILAIVFTIIYCLIYKYAGIVFITSTVGKVVLLLISATISINIGLGVFNLIPLPPLDGSKILNHFLPTKIRLWFEQNQYILYMYFVVIWVTGIASLIITPCIHGVIKGLFIVIGNIFNID
jgi:Zn-dependent protease